MGAHNFAVLKLNHGVLKLNGIEVQGEVIKKVSEMPGKLNVQRELSPYTFVDITNKAEKEIG